MKQDNAADYIRQLQAEIERLRALVQDALPTIERSEFMQEWVTRARRALEEPKKARSGNLDFLNETPSPER